MSNRSRTVQGGTGEAGCNAWLKQLRRGLAIACAASLCLGAPSAMAAPDDEGEPGAGAMAMDLLIARPAGAVFTGVGALVFVVSLPFTAAGGNVSQAAEQLVTNPARATFVRCLGCRTTGRYQNTD